MPRGLIEASYDLGYGRPTTFFKVVLPYLVRGVATSFSIVLLTAATSVAVSDRLLPDSRDLTLISNVIYVLTASFNSYQFVSALGLIIITLLILVTLHLLVSAIPPAYLTLKLRPSRRRG